jgi:hypothetical protein
MDTYIIFFCLKKNLNYVYEGVGGRVKYQTRIKSDVDSMKLIF